VHATKASGFRGARGAKWWTKDSKYGVKYQCSSCGKITLGTGNDSDMHWSACGRRKTAEADAITTMADDGPEEEGAL
jgi:hypothetical protein